MRKYNIYLDDERQLPAFYNKDEFLIPRSFDACVEMFSKYQIGILSLDHDLGTDGNGDIAKTGYDFVKYFVENNLMCDEIRFHTANPVGRQNMLMYLLSAQKHGVISKNIKIGR